MDLDRTVGVAVASGHVAAFRVSVQEAYRMIRPGDKEPAGSRVAVPRTRCPALQETFHHCERRDGREKQCAPVESRRPEPRDDARLLPGFAPKQDRPFVSALSTSSAVNPNEIVLVVADRERAPRIPGRSADTISWAVRLYIG